jgi:ATP-dependent DNA helicase RecG
MPIMDRCATLERLLSEGREKPWLEFKLNNSHPTQVGEYISALSNGALLQGKDKAFLVFGIRDGTLEKAGTSFSPADTKIGNESLVNWLTRKIDPQIKTEFHEFSCDELNFVLLEIEPSYYKPVKFDGTAYVRIGQHKKRLEDHPELERSLWLATGRRKFESAIAYANVSSTDVLELLNWRSWFSLQGLPEPTRVDEIIKTLVVNKIISDEYDSSYAITNLGALLLAKDITAFPSVARKTVRVTRYLGNDARNPAGEVEGRYGYAVGFEGLIAFIAEKSQQREKQISGVRQSIPVIPTVAIREMVANALIHQDFTTEGSGPIIEIYESRIEISNPGPPLGHLDRLIDEPPRSRNELLARTMRTLKLCEERGKGIDIAISAIESVASDDKILLSAPQFRATESTFTATLFGPKRFKDLSREEKLRICYQHCVLAYLRNDNMSNTTLRERFSLNKDDYQLVSAIISDAIKQGMIVPADTMQGRRNARYVPAWGQP